jgi:predicted HicB family RNase H-like nuclease
MMTAKDELNFFYREHYLVLNFDPEEKLYFGWIKHWKERVMFEGDTADELYHNFKTYLDEYLNNK